MHIVQSQENQPIVHVIGRAAGICIAVVIVALLSAWLGGMLRPVGLALMWLQFASAVFIALKLFGFAPVHLLLMLVGYQGDRYDLPDVEPSLATWFAQFVEFGCCIGALAILLRFFYA